MKAQQFLVRLTGLAFAALALVAGHAHAQGYPNRAVRVIVTFPPGGTPDIYGRIMSNELSKLWNQSVVVENRTGAAGAIGSDFVAKSTPDGYTLLFAADASITVTPNLVPNLPYDPVRDFAPIVLFATAPEVLTINPALGVTTVAELVARARDGRRQLNFGSAGAGRRAPACCSTTRRSRRAPRSGWIYCDIPTTAS